MKHWRNALIAKIERLLFLSAVRFSSCSRQILSAALWKAVLRAYILRLSAVIRYVFCIFVVMPLRPDLGALFYHRFWIV